MSETTAAPAETSAPTPKDVAEATPGKAAGETPEQTIEALRAALVKANSEARDNRLKAKELDELKVAQMSELDRAKAEAEANRSDAATARAEALRWRIAAKHGISDEDAETFLTGNDEESLTKQAERLASLAQSTTTPGTPMPDRTQGGSGQPATPLNGDGLEKALKDKLGIA